MVQNVAVPRDELRGDECWNRNEKTYVDVSHDPAAAAAAGSSHSSLPNLTRYQPQSHIQTALMNCGLDVAEFVLIYSGSDGNSNPTVLSSPGMQKNIHRIVTDHACTIFSETVFRSRNELGLQNPEDARSLSHFGSETGHQSSWDHKLISPTDYRLAEAKAEDSDEARSPRSRKRVRVRRHCQDSVDDHPTPIIKTQPLTIGNDADVDRFYFIRFKDMQQSACKVMGKAFVKLVEPRKQTHHPYTGGNDKAPSWWPPTKGDNAVRHKEPDHLLKPERINLLVHILKMIIEPSDRQNPTVQKLDLNVRKLEETTMEVMSNWFSDKEHPENFQKKKFLREIFRVARSQERYKRGEIDGSTTVPVMCGVENMTQDCSDDDEEVVTFVNDQEIEASEGLQTTVTGAHSPDNILSPPLLQPSDNEMRLPSQSLRHSLQRAPLSTSPYDSPLYRLDPNTFQPTPQQIPNLSDIGRRSYAQPGFSSPQSSLSQWSAPPAMNNSTQSNMYYSQPSSSFTYLPPPQQQPQQPTPSPGLHSAHHGFEGLHIGGVSTNRGGFDSGHSIGSSQQPLRSSNLSSLTYPSQAQAPYSYGGQGSNIYNQSDHDLKHDPHQHQRR